MLKEEEYSWNVGMDFSFTVNERVHDGQPEDSRMMHEAIVKLQKIDFYTDSICQAFWLRERYWQDCWKIIWKIFQITR